MTTTSNKDNCVIYNMVVAKAEQPNHEPHQPILLNFYNSLTPEQLFQYYASSEEVMTRLKDTTKEQWVDYYNKYMPNIMAIMKVNQHQAVFAGIMGMLTTIGK